MKQGWQECIKCGFRVSHQTPWTGCPSCGGELWSQADTVEVNEAEKVAQDAFETVDEAFRALREEFDFTHDVRGYERRSGAWDFLAHMAQQFAWSVREAAEKAEAVRIVRDR